MDCAVARCLRWACLPKNNWHKCFLWYRKCLLPGPSNICNYAFSIQYNSSTNSSLGQALCDLFVLGMRAVRERACGIIFFIYVFHTSLYIFSILILEKCKSKFTKKSLMVNGHCCGSITVLNLILCVTVWYLPDGNLSKVNNGTSMEATSKPYYECSDQ